MAYLFILVALLAICLMFLYKMGFLLAALYLAYTVMIFCVIALALLITHFYRVVFQGKAPYIRTSFRMVKNILGEINFKEGAIVYELGCGDGRFLRTLARNYKVKAVGYENFIVPYVLSRLINWLRQSKIKIYFKDFYIADLSDADYIFCYLVPEQMNKLEPKLLKELKPGALIISNTFKFPTWQPEKEVIIEPGKFYKLSNKFLLYRKI